MSIWEQYVGLHGAVEKVADVFDGMDIGSETFEAFNCEEIETIALMLLSAGRQDTANQIIKWHAQGDEMFDAHWLGPKKEES